MEDNQRVNKIEIRGFRGLSNLELDGLGAFNILLGANDVGKTSVLEAIFLLSGFANLSLPITVQNWRNLRVNDFDDLALLFHNLDVDTPIKLAAYSSGSVEHQELKLSASHEKMEMDIGDQRMADSGNGSARGIRSAERAGDQSSSAVSAGPRVLRYNATVKPRQKKPWSFSNAIRVVTGDNIQFAKPMNPVNKQTILGRYVTAAPGYASDVIGNVIIQKKAETLVKFLQVINPRITNIAVSGDVAYADVGLDKMIPLNMFGSGMTRAATILSPCILGKEQILLIDELENGLHHAAVLSLLQALLTLSRDQGMQVFVTTHSISVLESLLQALREEEFSEYRATTNCYTLQRDKNGLVRPYRYEYAQFEHCIRHGIEIR